MEPLVLPIDPRHFRHLPKVVNRGGTPFVLKEEFHHTVLNRAQQAAIPGHHREPAIRERLRRYAEEVTPRLPDMRTPTCLHLREDEAQTLAQLLDCPPAFELAADLRDLSLDVADPVPHVTLYVHRTEIGIGIADEDERRTLQVGEPFPIVQLLAGGN
ncbi:MAG: hypothetical protein ACQEXJ_13005 [Myxococcota bacterium]